jgi:hypothetical protein
MMALRSIESISENCKDAQHQLYRATPGIGEFTKGILRAWKRNWMMIGAMDSVAAILVAGSLSEARASVTCIHITKIHGSLHGSIGDSASAHIDSLYGLRPLTEPGTNWGFIYPAISMRTDVRVTESISRSQGRVLVALRDAG